MNQEDVIGAVQEVKGTIVKTVARVIVKERPRVHDMAEEMIGRANTVENGLKSRIRSALTPSASVGFPRSVTVTVLGAVILVAILRRSRQDIGRIGPAVRSGWCTVRQIVT
jgi:hypothetical protein